ncbi:MAG TPA: autotransporter-associated beta strand repeat-containing protein [Verrucomicrobiae bacterium]|nr:autotransporter-associated beta strand repeat-containing protein [Verrucomicrobiae bacterium]
MKTPTNFVFSKSGRLSGIKALTVAAALVAPAATGWAQTLWTDGTADFNTPADWNGTYIDTGTSSPNPNCDNDTGSNNVILIQPGDPAWYHGDTLAGQNANSSGAYLQTGSTNFTGYPANGNWLRMGIGSGSYGSYILSNGVVNVAGRTQLGENGTGYLEVDGGVYNTGYNGNPGIVAGQGDFGPGMGTLVLTGGTINNINNETWFGEQGGSGSGVGHFFMSGGTFNAHNWFVFGRNGGTGYGVMTGGTINFTGGGQFLVGGGGIGSLFQSGGTINVNNQYLIPQSGNSTDVGTNILSGTAVLNVHDWLAVGRNGGYGELDISNGASITRDNGDGDGGANFDVGASGKGIVNQNGGSITNLAGHTYIGESGQGIWNLNSGIASLGAVVMALNSSASGTFNLNGGLLQVSGISIGNSSAGSEMTFGGGTIQATGDNPSFISGLTQVLMNGGVTIDSQGYNITVPQEIDDASGGTLVKIGSGTLALTGPNTYAGNSVVSNGTLIVQTGSGANGNYIVEDGAALQVNVISGNGQLAASSLTLGNSTGSSVNFNLGNFGNPGSAPLNVGGPVTVNGPTTINIADTLPQVGTFPLIQSSGITGSGSFVLGSVPTGVTANLVVTSTSVSLAITVVNLPIWQGLAGGTWDIGVTTNWINLGTGLPTYFANGNAVAFNDSAPGATNVNITTTVSPSSITVNNNALSYTFTGSGSISGSTGLTKAGTNSLAVVNSTPNSYTGPTVIDAGVLSVSNLANGGSASGIGASSASPTNLVLAGGALAYAGPAVSINRGYAAENTNGTVDIYTVSNLTVSGAVAAMPGDGFTKAGAAQLTYANSGSNTLSDILGYNVAQGTVAFTGSSTNDINGNFIVDGTNSLISVPLFTNAAVSIANNAVLNLVSGGTFDVADSGNSTQTNTAVITQTGGTLNSSGAYQIWIGQGQYGVGTYNLSGGTFIFNNWLAIGRENGTGTFNLSGGELEMITGNGGNLDIGTSAGVNGASGFGVLNQTAGIISNTVSQTWFGEGAANEPASGIWNMTGGTAWIGFTAVGKGGIGTNVWNISGTANIAALNNNNIDMGSAAGATGILNLGSTNTPGGTVTVTADFNVGAAGAGVLNTVPGGNGTLIVDGTLYLTRNSTASGYIYLNPGNTIIADYVNNGWGFNQNMNPPTNAQAFYFNGGTLQAGTSSGYFIQPYVSAVIETNGAFINDGGYAVSAECVFADAAGSTAGLTKSGSGTLILTATNTFTGPTVITSGSLSANVLAGGVNVNSGGSFLSANIVGGPVTVASGGTLGGNVGTIGTVYINNTLTLASGSTTILQLTPASNDQIAGLTGVTYGGSLIVSNISSTPLTVGSQFKLFNCAIAGTGNFSTVTVLPSGTGTFDPSTGVLTITSVGAPTFNRVTLSGGNLIFTGSGFSPGNPYEVLSATNLLTPVPNWVTNVSGTFGAGGTFSNGIPVNSSEPAQFFMLKTP